jgi:uncharacterized membrane protein
MERTRLLFDAILRPHRSLGPRGFLALMVFVALVSFAAGIAFVSIGAWPVFGFFGLDVLALYVAFRMNYRSGRLYETVQLDEAELRVARVQPSGRSEAWSFPSYWARVAVVERRDGPGGVVLASHGRSVAVGAFLTPEERESFAAALGEALRKARHAD